VLEFGFSSGNCAETPTLVDGSDEVNFEENENLPPSLSLEPDVGTLSKP
jgi:hypothetical protein